MTTRSEFVGANGDGGVMRGGVAVVGMVVGAASLAAAHQANAQSTSAPDMYEVIDLGPWTAGAAHWTGASPAISNAHEVVWTWLDQEGKTHPAIWLDCPRADFPTKVGHPILQSAAGACLDCILDPDGPGCDACQFEGGANDINLSGVVAGYAIVGPDGARDARGWVCKTIGVGWSEYVVLGTLAPDGLGWSVAHGINDWESPIVVGEATTALECVGGGATHPTGGSLDRPGRIHAAYRAQPFQASVALGLTSLGYFDVEAHSGAWDASNGVSFNLAGERTRCPLVECRVEDYGVWWGEHASALLEQAGGGAASFGVNASGWFVGWAYFGSPCESAAAVWEGHQSQPLDIGELIPEPLLAVGSHANKIGGVVQGTAIAVGASGNSEAAIRWSRDASGAWGCAPLEGLVSRGFGWQLTEATDVSDDGWIVGYGWSPNEDPGGPQHAFLLKPILCVGDLDRDGVIGGADLTLFLEAFAAGGGLADLDMNGQTTGADLALFLGRWGITCEATGCPVTDESVANARRTQGEATLQFGLGAMGFGCLESYQGWCAQATEDQKRCLHECLACCMQAANGGE